MLLVHLDDEFWLVDWTESVARLVVTGSYSIVFPIFAAFLLSVLNIRACSEYVLGYIVYMYLATKYLLIVCRFFVFFFYKVQGSYLYTVDSSQILILVVWRAACLYAL